MRTIARFRSDIPRYWESEQEHQRWHHEDVTNMSPRQVWAEIVMVEWQLALRISQGQRARIIAVTPDGMPIDAETWLLGRLTALKAHSNSRGMVA